MYLFNYLSFQACWMVLTIYGNLGIVALGIFLYVHFILIYCLDDFQAVKLELTTLMLVCIIGIGADMLLVSAGIYNFADLNILPYWYIAIWVLFASTLNHCFCPFWNLPSIMVSLLAAIFAPISYLGMTKMSSNFTIAQPYEVSLVVICALWFILLPLFMKLTLLLRRTILKQPVKQAY